jgi:hypothetical protein
MLPLKMQGVPADGHSLRAVIVRTKLMDVFAHLALLDPIFVLISLIFAVGDDVNPNIVLGVLQETLGRLIRSKRSTRNSVERRHAR